MINLLKKYWFVFGLFLVVIVLLLIKIYLPDQVSKTPKLTWRGVVPGKEKVDSLITKLGRPQNQSYENGKLALEYVKGEEIESLVYVQNNTVDLVKDYSSRNKKLSDFENEFGKPEEEFYGPHQSAGFKVFVFAPTGVAVIAKPETGTVIEVWYFEPTNLQTFLSRWGTGFTTEREEAF